MNKKGREAADAKNALGYVDTVLNSLDVMIYVTDPNTDEILFMSDGMKRHYGIEGDPVGSVCYRFLQDGIDQRCEFCPCIQLDREPDKIVIWEENSTLTKRCYRNYDRYIQWPGGKTVHIQHSFDITEHKELLEKTKYLSEYEMMKYTLTNDALSIGLWDMTIVSDDPVGRNDAIIYSREVRQMLGFTDQHDFPDVLSSWIERIHPEDAERVLSAVAAHLGDYTGKTLFDVEYRFLMKNGPYRHFRSFGNTLRDSLGAPVRAAGAIMDIDEKTRVQEQRNEALEKLERREKMLSALNEMAMAFLSHETESFEDVMSRGLKPLTAVAGVDRVAIYRLLDGKSRLGQIYLWYGKTIPLEDDLLLLPEIPSVLRWLDILVKSGRHNANVDDMAEDSARFLKQIGVKAMFSVPIFDHGKFWGVVTMEDHTRCRYFDEDCLDVLQSAAHLCASAVIRNEMERDLAAEKLFIRDIIDAAPTGVMIRDEHHTIVDCNNAFISILGDFTKQHYFEHYADFSPEYQPDGLLSAEKMKRFHEQALGGEELTLDWMFRSPAGEEIPCELTVTRVKYNNRYRVLTYIYDLRNIKKMEREIAETETTQVMLDSVPLSCTLIGKDFSIIDCNKEAERLFGVSKQKLRSRFFSFSPETQPDGQNSKEKAFAFFEKTFEKGRTQFEWLHTNAAGDMIPCEVTLVRVKHKDNDIIAGYTKDLRELKTVEAEMHEAEARTQIMLDSVPLGANLWNRDFRLIDCNQAAPNLFGLSDKKEYIEQFYRFSPEFQPDGRNSGKAVLAELKAAFDKEGYGRFEWMMQKEPGGEQIPCEITLARVKHKDDYVVVSYIRDLRELKKAEAEREKAIEEKTALSNLGNILNGLDAMVCVTDPKTYEILFMNSYMKEHYGVKGDVVGQICYRIIRGGIDRPCDFCPCAQLDKAPDSTVIWEEQDASSKRIYRNVGRYIKWPNGQMVHVRYSVDMTELIAAKEYAEESNRSKDIFLAHMSHEIRTPMNAILGVSEIQLFNEHLSAEAKEGFVRIYESGSLLLNIINDILDFSKIDAGKMEIAALRYEVPSMVNDAVQLNLLHNEGKPIDFALQMDENTPVELIGDELRIKQILNNVLSNAFKYTESGRIELAVSAAPGGDDDTVILLLRVSDTGQGMSQGQIGKLFEEYSRFNREANRGISGTGLGMNITKRLIEKMNGEIFVESEIGKGSVFTVRLPQKTGGAALCGAELVNRLQDFSYHNASVSRKLQIVREHMPYGRVLVVDDIESNLYVAKGLLTPYGLHIETAKSGAEAIDKIKAGGDYDIVFMDHMMPKMDGIQATAHIRAMGYTRPVVALTANAVSGQAEMFLSSGFDGFISKPIDLRELDKSLTTHIRDTKPPEVVEAARRGAGKTARAPFLAQPKNRTHELEEFFVLDAEKTISVLDVIIPRIHALDDAEWRSYVVAVHGIKSALAIIGETALSDAALALENAGRARDAGAVADGTPALLDGLHALVRQFKPANVSGAVEIAAEDAVFLREKLRIVRAACITFDKKTAKSALAELKQKTWPPPTAALLDEISLTLLHGEFKKAAALVDKEILV